ncbi:MAG: hypothetical protein ACOCRX_04945 [Candidatus Woesearchaeota archaeon]
MSCDLNRASEKFQELIDNQSTNLEYLNQLNATFQAAQENMWGKAISLATDLIDDAFGDQLNDFLGENMSFDKIKSIVQLVALVNPGVFGECMKKEINKLEKFFKNELELATMVIEYFGELIEQLNGDWNIILEPGIKEKNQKELNELINKKLPEAGQIVKFVKDQLIGIEGEIYNNNSLSEINSNKINSLINELEKASNNFTLENNESILMILLKMINQWNKIKETLNKMNHPHSDLFISLEEGFKDVGQNFKNSIENLLILLQTVRTALMELDLTDEMMFQNWKSTAEHLIKNLELEKKYNSAKLLKDSIDKYIETKDIQFIEVAFPLISSPITEASFKTWEEKADFIKLNQTNWSRQIDKSIIILKNLTDEKYNDVLNSFDSIYSMITDQIIEAYINLSTPFWNQLFRRIDEIDYILNSLIKGVELTDNLKTKFLETQSLISNIYNAINNSISIFENEKPADSLVENLGLSSTTTGLIQSLINLSDYLGLDVLSDMIDKGDIAGIFNLSEEEGDSINQFLTDLNCLDEVNEETKNASFQIRNMVIDNQRRKEKLQQTASSLLEKGIKEQEQQINNYKELNNILKSSLK